MSAKGLKVICLTTFCLLSCLQVSSQNLFKRNERTEVYLSQDEKEVVHTALEILQSDVENVFNAQLVQVGKVNQNTKLVAGTIEDEKLREILAENGIDISAIWGKWETFQIKKMNPGQLLIVGSDARGLAYGLLELSRMIGVSPWEWWADVYPDKRDSLAIAEVEESCQSPSVQYRGIFLNDEDWALTPWSTKNFEPEASSKYSQAKHFIGQVGPKTYAKVFELLLRLRANTIWPAMHEVTVPFYFVEGNLEMAKRYGIVVSTSHCEPMMRNSATEWDLVGKGEYNFLTNRNAVLEYWVSRLKELGDSENIFTLGMRGKHDGRMIGVKNTAEYKDALNEVLKAQDSLLKVYINPDVEKIPQQFVPYKEVLDVCHAGLQIPDNVTLVWPDDNFGYIRHFPTEDEKKRSGGNGVYYHTSYWGVPHDFLWLGIVQPSLMYQQMQLAYERGMRKIWILNVGDIKPSEYLTELFLDLAWNINLPACKAGRGIVYSHLENWLVRTFGSDAGRDLLPVMKEFYLLSHIRKPEFMGNTRVYERGYEQVSDLPWSVEEIQQRLLRFKKIADKIESLYSVIPENRKAAYFEMIQYPILSSNEMNKKMLFAQFARHSATDSVMLWQKSDMAYDSIVSLTDKYNSILDGKWKYMMSFKPRGLTVFNRVKHAVTHEKMKDHKVFNQLWNGTQYTSMAGKYVVVDGLGHDGKAVYLSKGSAVEYAFNGNRNDSLTVSVHLVPTHAVENGRLRFSVSIDDEKPLVFDYETEEFSPEWKDNILRAQAIKTATFRYKKTNGCIRIIALDEGIVIDQVELK